GDAPVLLARPARRQPPREHDAGRVREHLYRPLPHAALAAARLAPLLARAEGRDAAAHPAEEAELLFLRVGRRAVGLDAEAAPRLLGPAAAARHRPSPP